MSVPGSSPVVLSPKDRDLVKTAMRATDMPAPSVCAASDTLEDVQPDDPPPVSMISTSFLLSSLTPTVSLGLVASSLVVPFLSSPAPSRPCPLLIVLLEPGCNIREEELAEEVLTIKELQQYFPALREDTETLPPDIVSDAQASPPSAVSTSIATGDHVQATSVELAPPPLSNPLLLVSEPDECVCLPSSEVTLPFLACIQEEVASSPSGRRQLTNWGKRSRDLLQRANPNRGINSWLVGIGPLTCRLSETLPFGRWGIDSPMSIRRCFTPSLKISRG